LIIFPEGRPRDIDIRPFIAEAGSSVLAARRLTDYLQDYFTQEKICHGIG